MSSPDRMWTSGATRRRRRHRLTALALIGGLLLGAIGVSAVNPDRSRAGVPALRWPAPAPVATPEPDVVPAPAPVLDPAPEPDPAPDPGPAPAPRPAPAPEPEPSPAPEPASEPARGDAQREDATAEIDVLAVQARLREFGYLVGPADGKAGQQTIGAVMAFQQVHGLAVDGIVGPATLAALDGGTVHPTLRDGPSTRIEVDLDRQILHVVEDGVRVATLKISSGNGEPYRTAAGGTAVARTPVGGFVVLRRIHGARQAPLGTLYDPLYFHGGYAIHGSPSVPAGPASHGCVRVTRADARWLIERIADGTPVHLYGGTHVFTPTG